MAPGDPSLEDTRVTHQRVLGKQAERWQPEPGRANSFTRHIGPRLISQQRPTGQPFRTGTRKPRKVWVGRVWRQEEGGVCQGLLEATRQNVECGRTLALGIARPLGVQTPAKSKQSQAFRNDPTSLQVANGCAQDREQPEERDGFQDRVGKTSDKSKKTRHSVADHPREGGPHTR